MRIRQSQLMGKLGNFRFVTCLDTLALKLNISRFFCLFILTTDVTSGLCTHTSKWMRISTRNTLPFLPLGQVRTWAMHKTSGT